REVEPGFLFVAMDGQHTDGHRFIPDALRRGAAAVLLSRMPEGAAETVSWIQVGNPRTSLSPLAAAFYGHPSRSLRVIGVTGTDGKSSTVWFIAQLLGMLGKKAGFLSTVSFQTGDQVVKNPFRQSTPEATEIHGMLREMVDIGKEYAIVEATSHGLSARMNRLGDVAFDAAVLTNVTHEHLEFHGSFEQYRSDNANLFRALARAAGKSVSCPRFAVVNSDEPSADYFRAASGCPVYSYGVRAPADLAARVVGADIGGTTFRMIHRGREADAHVSIPGPFWVENVLAAALTVASILQIDPLDLAPRVRELTSVRGRMDYVDRGQPFAVIVDYAHTPGAFRKLLPWVREHTRGKVIAVFGSAGERDGAKRRMQGEAAAEHCDTIVLADEDPRGEDSMQILEQIAEGCAGRTRGKDLLLIPDRREAVRRAAAMARPGDTVLLLGKGHEGSIIGPAGPAAWDEREEAEAALGALGYAR
ncbi:MAG: UDP-N-acetylmuramoyl-L-alanyl-D-glutamate--2,6-diaminopimelate ligase, partial [Spirochaetia bacterium]